jgi:hypothetical protein
MKLTPEEVRFLTALIREQNQTGCRGPAHDLLRKHAYPDAPLAGPGSLAFSYEVVPLAGLLLKDHTDLQDIDDFLRKGERITDLAWPWASAEEFRAKLEEARKKWVAGKPARRGNDSDGKSVPAQKSPPLGR